MTSGTNEDRIESGQTTFRAHSGLRNPLIVRGLILVGLLAVAALIFATLPRVLGTDRLSFSEPIEDGVVNFVNDDGEHIGTFFSRYEKSPTQAPKLTVQVPVADGYNKDSISLRISTVGHLPVSLEASSYGFDQRIVRESLTDVIYEATNLGFYGRGTITLDFTIGYPETETDLLVWFDIRRHSTSYPYQKQQMAWSVNLGLDE